MSSEKITIGIPANNGAAMDCQTVRRLLELEGGPGVLTSRFVPGARFRTARVRDVTRFLREGLYQLGIIGDDVAIEDCLALQKSDDRLKDRETPLEGKTIESPQKCFPLAGLPETTLALLRRKEDVGKDIIDTGRYRVVTSYPGCTWKFTRADSTGRILEVGGQVEAALRAGDGGVIEAVDVVRTGKTIQENGLAVVRELLISQPGLWRVSPDRGQYPPYQRIPETQIGDTVAALQERLQPLLQAAKSSRTLAEGTATEEMA